MADYTLELLHAADQEAGIPALDDAPRFSAVLNALKAQDLGNDGIEDNTLVLSAGDAILPGLFFSASEDIYGRQGVADILIQNQLGFQAIALGNHEFDLGTEFLASLILPGFVTSAALEEAQQVSGVPDGPATGEFSATLTGNTLTVKGEFSDLASPLLPVGGEDSAGNGESAIHIHIGAAGTNGPIARNLTVTEEDNGAGEFEGTFTLTDEEVELAKAGGLYVNLHTETYNSGELRGQITPDFIYGGTGFPYLSANLNFSTDPNLAALVGPDGVAPQPNTVAASTIIDVNGEKIGVVGATTPTVSTISSLGDVTVLPETFSGTPTDPELDALAAEIQADVDALLAANPEVNKVVLLSHMQQLAIEQALAERLTKVDIIVAGGSNTRLLDETDPLRDGDTDQGDYPIFKTDAAGNPVAVVNTDGNYKYVGRLVIDFTENGVIIPESYQPQVSGVYATDAQGVAELGAEGLVDAEIQAIVNALRQVIEAKESNVFGVSQVYLDGTRGSVRTQETNLGNLTADANLAIAREITADDTILVSLKNGGGIRDDIGRVIVPAGGTGDAEELPNEAIPGVKPEGGISETDIANTLRFNNGLTVLDITREGLLAVLEHGIAASSLDDTNTQGRFPQVSGVEFSFDLTAEAGNRIQNAAIKAADGTILDVLVQNGELVGDGAATVRIVTLGFLAGGGDGYPFQEFGSNFQDLAQTDEAPRTGDATFAPDGSEQDALAEYLFDNFLTVPFDAVDTEREQDTRLQNLAFRDDTVLIGGINGPTAPVAEPDFSAGFEGPFTRLAGIELADGAEINAYDPASEKLFVVSGEPTLQVVDLSNPLNPVVLPAIDLSEYGGGINSVAVANGLLAVAVAADEATENGTVVFLDADGTVLNTVTVGALPDMVTFTPDGSKVLVANEGEPNFDYSIDPEGSISIIDLGSGVENASVTTADFTGFNSQRQQLTDSGVKLFGPEGTTVAAEVEPEYIAVSPDGTTAWATLQEANAVAAVDIASATVSAILPLGFKDFSQGPKLDASNEDGRINLQNWPVFGVYQPDSIASYRVDGITYYVTANEGDARIRPDGDIEDETGAVVIEEGAFFNEEARVKDVVLDLAAFPNAAELQREENLGRLNITTALGDTDGDGDFDQLYGYGARSFSIWDETGNLVFDSGDDIARITAQLTPELFNANDGDPEEFDNRSDDKGAEPEALTIGQIGDTTYAFVGLERAGGGVLIYDITSPFSPEFVQYVRDDADIAPEGLSFIPAAISPNGQNLLLVTNEESSTLAIYAADDLPGPTPGEPTPEMPAEVFDLTGFDGQVTATVTLTREASYDNLLRFYETDANGTVNGLRPNDAGYEDAVRQNLVDIDGLFVSNRASQDTSILLAGGSYYAPALLVDGDIDNLITINDNVNGQSMIIREGNTWKFEDWTDFDYNDFVFTLNAVESALV